MNSPVQTLNTPKEFLKRVEQLTEKLEGTFLIEEKENEKALGGILEMVRQNPAQTASISSALARFQETLNRVSEQCETLVSAISEYPLIAPDNAQKTLPKSTAKAIAKEEKRSPEGKKFKKKLGKRNVITHMDIHKGYFCSLLEILNAQHFRLDHNAYRKIVIRTFDFLPYISQKVSHYTTSREVYVEMFTFMWKLATFPAAFITFSEQQKITGQPEILPIRYGSEGALHKATNVAPSKKVVVKKGCFSFSEDSVHVEAVRLCKKIYTNSTKHLTILSNTPGMKEEKREEFPGSTMREMIKEIKENIMSKVFLYKINFLSFLLWTYMENPKFDAGVLKTRDFKIDFFERAVQAEHVRAWEAQILSHLD